MKERLKELRKVFNLKQRQLAERLGVTVGLVGTWESGSAPVPKTRIYQICKEFRVRRDWLEMGEGEMMEPPSEERKLCDFPDHDVYLEAKERLYNALPNGAKQAFQTFCNNLKPKKTLGVPISFYNKSDGE